MHNTLPGRRIAVLVLLVAGLGIDVTAGRAWAADLTPTPTRAGEISVAPSTLSLGCQGSFDITITNTGATGTMLEISSLTLAHGYSQGYYGTGFTWDLSHITLPASLGSSATLTIPVTFSAAGQPYPSRLEVTIDSNAANAPHLLLVYFGGSQDACAIPTLTPTTPVVDHATPTETPTPTPTATSCPTGTSVTATATPTATAIPAPCVGDCRGDGQVTIDELLILVNIALGNLHASACLAGDANHHGQITVDEILTAVNYALTQCPTSRVCGGFAGLLCQSGEVCNLHDSTCAVVDLAGECVERPEICPDLLDPVCGCDAVTYANDCWRLNAGATLAHVGVCQ